MMWGLLVAADLGKLAGVCATAAVLGGAIVGILFRGAASAWKEERDAARDKADRLEVKVGELETKLDKADLRIAELEKRTDYESHAKLNTREHNEILKALQANTTAVEFLAKQLLNTD